MKQAMPSNVVALYCLSVVEQLAPELGMSYVNLDVVSASVGALVVLPAPVAAFFLAFRRAPVAVFFFVFRCAPVAAFFFVF